MTNTTSRQRGMRLFVAAAVSASAAISGASAEESATSAEESAKGVNTIQAPTVKVSADELAPAAPHMGEATLVKVAGQNLISNPRGAVANFDVASLGPILSELGITWKSETSQQGQTFITANIGGQLGVNFIPSACINNGVSNCIGLNAIAYFTGAPNQQTVSAFNQKYWFASAGMMSNGQAAYISRYDIADYGIARGNIASSISNFAVLAELFRRELASSGRTVSLDGYADDLSARFLNKQGLAQFANTSAPQTLMDHHNAAFEQTPQLISDVLKAPGASKNKITNVTVK